MNHIHEIVRCRVCGTVVQQCRCIAQDKPERLVVCGECQDKSQLPSPAMPTTMTPERALEWLGEIQSPGFPPEGPRFKEKADQIANLIRSLTEKLPGDVGELIDYLGAHERLSLNRREQLARALRALARENERLKIYVIEPDKKPNSVYWMTAYEREIERTEELGDELATAAHALEFVYTDLYVRAKCDQHLNNGEIVFAIGNSCLATLEDAIPEDRREELRERDYQALRVG